MLQFDSTINYAKGQSNINTRETEINGNHDPYNTYNHKGLPPGPIGNPGRRGPRGGAEPDDGRLVLLRGDRAGQDTEFTKTQAEHDKKRQGVQRYQREHDG